MAEYITPLTGGLIIGYSAALMMLFLGRITGISGIFWNAVNPSQFGTNFLKNRLWRWLFILGLPLGAWLANELFSAVPESMPSNNPFLILVSGLLVGYGAHMANGCTSGHGVCGIGRFSFRAMIATLLFMSSGTLTVTLVNLFGPLL